MDISAFFDNLLSPPILFFFVGVAATLLKSDLEIPAPIPKLFSLYLLWAIGFKGGVELARSGFSPHIVAMLAAGIGIAAVTPFFAFGVLKRVVGRSDAAAIAACYGSVSVVTFITAVQFLENRGITFGGYMVAATALMESPAIIVGVLLARRDHCAVERPDATPHSAREIVREAFLNGPVFLILGSMVVGALASPRGAALLTPFTQDIFHGVLVLFLLDMGLIAARRLGELRASGWRLPAFAVAMPFFNALIGIGIARLLGAQLGDALLLAVLAASASYIAVPAALRLAIPEANPGLYLPMSLGITFPFNIALGLPLYLAIIEWLWSR